MNEKEDIMDTVLFVLDCLEQARKEVTKILGIEFFKEQEPITIYVGKKKHLETYNLYSEEML